MGCLLSAFRSSCNHHQAQAQHQHQHHHETTNGELACQLHDDTDDRPAVGADGNVIAAVDLATARQTSIKSTTISTSDDENIDESCSLATDKPRNKIGRGDTPEAGEKLHESTAGNDKNCTSYQPNNLLINVIGCSFERDIGHLENLENKSQEPQIGPASATDNRQTNNYLTTNFNNDVTASCLAVTANQPARPRFFFIIDRRKLTFKKRKSSTPETNINSLQNYDITNQQLINNNCHSSGRSIKQRISPILDNKVHDENKQQLEQHQLEVLSVQFNRPSAMAREQQSSSSAATVNDNNRDRKLSADSGIQLRNQTKRFGDDNATRQHHRIFKTSTSLDGGSSGGSPASSTVSSSLTTPTQNTSDYMTTSGQITNNNYETSLFCDVEQLCRKIISENIMLLQQQHQTTGKSNQQPVTEQIQHNKRSILCLFVFGVQGSNEGEILYELVDHSSLTTFLKKTKPSSHHQPINSIKNFEVIENCPLYHFTDLGVLIASHIDERIAQYRNIRKQTLKTKLILDAQLSGSSNEDLVVDLEGKLEQEQKASATTMAMQKLELDRCDTIDSVESSGQSSVGSQESKNSNYKPSAREKNDKFDWAKSSRDSNESLDFNCLSTSNKSRLELKLASHSNCVSSHWVISLIQKHIEKLEKLFHENIAKSDTNRENLTTTTTGSDNAKQQAQSRVYLIKMIPNHLSLFNACLFLKQPPSLHNFPFPFQAIKFERRTNIRVFRREPKVKKSSQKQAKSDTTGSGCGKRSPFGSLVNMKPSIRLSILSSSSSSSSSSSPIPKSNITNVNTPASPGSSLSQETSAKNSLESIIKDFVLLKDEKLLNSKLIDHFTDYFRNIHKLTTVRYNPIDRPFNKMSDFEQLDNLIYHGEPQETSNSSATALDAVADQGGDHSIDVVLTASNRFLTLPNQLGGNVGLLTPKLALASPRTHHQSHQKTNPIKWAVEIELIDSQASNSSTSVAGSGSAAAAATTTTDGKRRLWPLTGGSTANDELHHRQAAVGASGQDSNHHQLGNENEYDQHLYEQQQHSSNNHHHNHHHNNHRKFLKEYFEPINGKHQQHQMSSSNQHHHEETTGKSSNSNNLTGSLRAASNKSKSSYQLIPIRVAYPNGQNQLFVELRWSQVKSIKLKSRSDLSRLLKLVDKAKLQLEKDCTNWLYTSIGAFNNSSNTMLMMQQHHRMSISSTASAFPAFRPSASSSSLLLSASSGPSTSLTGSSNQAIGTHSSTLSSCGINTAAPSSPPVPLPSLIVFKIEVDISKLIRDGFNYPANFEPKYDSKNNLFEEETQITNATSNLSKTPLKSNLKSPQNSASRVCGNYQSPSTSLVKKSVARNEDSINSNAISEKPRSSSSIKRRVQFKLTDLPRLCEPESFMTSIGGVRICKPPEHRLWIDDTVFLGYCPPENRTRLTRSERQVLDVVSKLINYQWSIMNQGGRAKSAIGRIGNVGSKN